MNAQQLREQYMEDRGGIFNPGQQVEVNVNGVWMPGQIQEVANFTVRNTATGRNVNRRPDPTAINNYIEKNENTFKTLLIGGRRRNRKTLNNGKRKTKRKSLNKGKRTTKRRN